MLKAHFQFKFPQNFFWLGGLQKEHYNILGNFTKLFSGEKNVFRKNFDVITFCYAENEAEAPLFLLTLS